MVVSRRYRISSILGTGAFSEVYAAYDKQLHRNVALKVVHLSRPSLKPVVKAIIKREAKVLQYVYIYSYILWPHPYRPYPQIP